MGLAGDLSNAQKVTMLGFDAASPPAFGRMIEIQIKRIEAAQRDACREATAPATPLKSWGGFHAHRDALFAARVDVHFLLVAIGGLLGLAIRYRRLTGDAWVPQAEAAFERAAPGGKTLRDVVEHAEDYALGEGRLRRPFVVGISNGDRVEVASDHGVRPICRRLDALQRPRWTFSNACDSCDSLASLRQPRCRAPVRSGLMHARRAYAAQ